MATITLKVSRIGNSRGVRLPAEVLRRYQVGDSVIMEERSDGILLRPNRQVDPKLSWEETARAMATSAEDWGDWDAALPDGVGGIPWSDVPRQAVAETRRPYPTPQRKRKR